MPSFLVDAGKCCIQLQRCQHLQAAGAAPVLLLVLMRTLHAGCWAGGNAIAATASATTTTAVCEAEVPCVDLPVQEAVKVGPSRWRR